MLWLFAILAGCSGANEETPDGPEPVPSEETGPTDSGTPPSLEVGAWLCPERTDRPADFLSFKTNEAARPWTFPSVRDFLTEVEALAMGFVDEACLEGCDATGCVVQGCVTPSGATVDYTLSTTLGDTGYYGQDRRSELTIHVQPSSASWSDLAFTHSDVTEGSTGTDVWTVSWSGTLDPRWRDDGSVTVHETKSFTDYSDAKEISWEDGTCSWSFEFRSGFSTSYDMNVNGRTASVYDNYERRGDLIYAEAGLNGYPFGIVDRETWEEVSCF